MRPRSRSLLRCPPAEQIIHVSLGDGPDQDAPPGGSGPLLPKTEEQPWEVFPGDAWRRRRATSRPNAERPISRPSPVGRSQRDESAGRSARGTRGVGRREAAQPKAEGGRRNAVATRVPPSRRKGSSRRRRQHREARPAPTPAPAAPNDRLAAAAPLPSRTSSDDIPAALLQQIVPMPQPRESSTDDSLGAALERPIPLRLGPCKRGGKRRTGRRLFRQRCFGGAAADGPAADEPGRLAAPSVSGLAGKQGGDQRQEDAAMRLATNTPIVAPSRAARVAEGEQPVPDAYRLRVAPNRAKIAQSHGGTAATEAAVKAALKWLADNQAADGRWDPRTPRRRQGNQRARPRPSRRRQPRRHGDDGLGAAGVPRLRPHAPRRSVPRGRAPRAGVSVARSGRRWKSRRPRRFVRIHVLPCHGHLRVERGVWHDPRPPTPATRPARDRVYHCCAGPARRRVALPAAAIPATPANSAGN